MHKCFILFITVRFYGCYNGPEKLIICRKRRCIVLYDIYLLIFINIQIFTNIYKRYRYDLCRFYLKYKNLHRSNIVIFLLQNYILHKKICYLIIIFRIQLVIFVSMNVDKLLGKLYKMWYLWVNFVNLIILLINYVFKYYSYTHI